MDATVRQLQATINAATTYFERPDKTVAYVQYHMRNLEEDASQLIESASSLDRLSESALDLRIEARQLKRQFEEWLLDQPPAPPAQPQTPLRLEAVVKPKGLKLQPLKVPIFDGDATKFTLFWNFFVDNIANNDEMSETAKWSHLRNSVTGKAAELISEIPQTPEMLEVALKILEDVYGGDDKTITELYHKFHTLPQSSQQTMDVRVTHSKLEGILRGLDRLKHSVDENHYIRSVYIGKFPFEIIQQVVKTKDMSLNDIREAIAQLLLARESTFSQIITTEPAPSTSTTRTANPTAAPATSSASNATIGAASSKAILRRKRTDAETPEPPICLFCDVKHWADTCPTYTTAEERLLKAPDRCIKCIRPNHPGSECKRQTRCPYCDSMQHNRAFCPVKFPPKTKSEPVCLTHELVQPKWVPKRGCFLTCIVEVSSRAVPIPFKVRVLIDTAGSRTLITKSLAKRLRLRATNHGFAFNGILDDDSSYAAAIEDPIQFHALNEEIIAVGAYIVDSLTQDVAVPDVENFRQKYPQYKDLFIPPTGISQAIDILIGGDNLIDFVLFDRGIVVDHEHQLMATKLGWLISTREEVETTYNEPVLLINDDDHIRQMFDLEIVGLADLEKTNYEQEQLAITKYHAELEFENQRYYAGIPWEDESPQLSTNFGLAYGRLKSLCRKFQMQPQLLQMYHSIILKQETDDIIEKVFERFTSNITHYLPHHPVICPEKNTTIRLVYDGSAKTRPQDKSLNECILKGRKWLNDLAATLLRFRRTGTAVVSDISKAFHQIGVIEKHRDALRFLWLKDPTKPPTIDNVQIYRFKRVAFGIISSPFILDATITFHLNQQPQTPIIHVIREDLYADNIVTSLPNSISPTEFYTTTKAIFSSMSMNMTKWSSNAETVMQAIPEDDRNEETIQSVLGLRWNRKADDLAIKRPKEQRSTAQPSKRNVLRKAASVFDPLGWAVPVLLLAKLFLRRLWIMQAQWDEKLHGNINEEWAQISTYLDQTQLISLPRQMFSTSAAQRYEFHTFVDASIHAFAVVVYLLQITESNTSASFVAARNRLAPKKQSTIPKLELMAIHIGAKFTNYVKSALNLPQPTTTCIWSDSKCVLAWLQSTKVLPAIIHKQVQTIIKQQIAEFRYVPSHLNRADIASRGATYDELKSANWWAAPDWLLSRDDWPHHKTAEDTSTEISLVVNEPNPSTHQLEEIPETESTGVARMDITQFPSLHALFARTASVLRSLKKLLTRRNQHINLHSINGDEYTLAKIIWLRWDQKRANIHNKEQVGRLKLFTDADGLRRCYSRMPNAHLPKSTVNPIVLVKRSTLTKLIILHLHRNNKHAGTSHTLAALRRSYYLPQARREIFHVIATSCLMCRRHLIDTYPPPPPSPLPDFRVTELDSPFQAIGVDVCGPFYVRMQEISPKPQQKRWVVLFTCTATRAVHLEVIENMTTKELLLAFRRFTSRRGVPERIVCDNAPQFAVLDKKFQNLWQTFAANEQATQYFAPNETKWQFIPQHSPWMGGMYERLIQSVKKALERTYGDHILHTRQFETSILEIEAILNTRPLTYIEADSNEIILTPAHFLKLKYPALPISADFQHSDDIMAKMWKSSQNHLREFWKVWSQSYLLQLRDRDDQLHGRKRNSNTIPEIGEIVLLADPEIKRIKWQSAVVERHVPSADGQIRTVQIRLTNGARTLRPIIKLAPMKLAMNLPGVRNDQLNIKRDAIIVSSSQSPEDAALELQQNENEIEIIELGPEDVEDKKDITDKTTGQQPNIELEVQGESSAHQPAVGNVVNYVTRVQVAKNDQESAPRGEETIWAANTNGRVKLPINLQEKSISEREEV